MKKYILFLGFICSATFFSYGQVLPVNEVIQERDQWCWAACSKCMLDFYGFPKSQCDVAEYARTVISWRSFGTMDCCIDPDLGCNYWNYLWGTKGSVEDILVYFGALNNNLVYRALDLDEIRGQILANKCFIIRWGWESGGGHFLVGNGVQDSDVYYMNPWFGEGLHISTYDWLLKDGSHTWTHSDTLDIIVAGKLNIEESLAAQPKIEVYPNPSNGLITISAPKNIERVQLIDLTGRSIKQWKDVGMTKGLNINDLVNGVYYLQIESGGYAEAQKIVKN